MKDCPQCKKMLDFLESKNFYMHGEGLQDYDLAVPVSMPTVTKSDWCIHDLTDREPVSVSPVLTEGE